MEPSDSFYKAKRNALFWSGLLLVSVFIGISENDDGTSLLGFKLANPDYISLILTIITVYFAYNYISAWIIQNEGFHILRVHWLDSIITFSIFLFSVLSFILSWSGIFYLYSFILIISVFFISILFSYIIHKLLYKLRPSAIGSISSGGADFINELLNNDWNLLFYPDGNQNKNIKFLPDGNIGTGRNNNEATWRTNGPYLELLNNKGEIFSRFKFDKDSMQFRHTNDADTKSLRDQIIRLASRVSTK